MDADVFVVVVVFLDLLSAVLDEAFLAGDLCAFSCFLGVSLSVIFVAVVSAASPSPLEAPSCVAGDFLMRSGNFPCL